MGNFIRNLAQQQLNGLQGAAAIVCGGVVLVSSTVGIVAGSTVTVPFDLVDAATGDHAPDLTSYLWCEHPPWVLAKETYVRSEEHI